MKPEIETAVDYGKPPKTGWAKLVSELFVKDIDRSYKFWNEILGFSISYQRPEEGFMYLERSDGAQIMLYQNSEISSEEVSNANPDLGSDPHFRKDDTSAKIIEDANNPVKQKLSVIHTFMLQIFVQDLAPIKEAIAAANWPIARGPEEVWRRWGDREGGKREIRLSDPDDNLILVAEDIGERPVSESKELSN